MAVEKAEEFQQAGSRRGFSTVVPSLGKTLLLEVRMAPSLLETLALPVGIGLQEGHSPMEVVDGVRRFHSGTVS